MPQLIYIIIQQESGTGGPTFPLGLPIAHLELFQVSGEDTPQHEN